MELTSLPRPALPHADPVLLWPAMFLRAWSGSVPLIHICHCSMFHLPTLALASADHGHSYQWLFPHGCPCSNKWRSVRINLQWNEVPFSMFFRNMKVITVIIIIISSYSSSSSGSVSSGDGGGSSSYFLFSFFIFTSAHRITSSPCFR